jgi:4-hydroxybenzoate polyprenyltransferase
MRSEAVSGNATRGLPVRPGSIAFWRAYWLTLRPYLFFVSAASGLVGLALAPGLGWGPLLAAFLAFFFSYGLGQAVTDVFQTDTDSISAPYRPLVRGEIARVDVLAVSLAGLAACALVLAMLNPLTLALSALGVAGLLTYTVFKRRWWAGPFWNAWIVALLPLIGFLCGGAGLTRALADGPLRAGMLSVFFSYAVFVLLGYFKDIEADRATGYRTLPVVAGWQVSVWVSAGFAAAAAAAGAWLLLQVGGGGAAAGPAWLGGVTVWMAGVVMLAGAHGRMLQLRREDDAHRAIAPAVRGHVLLHLGLSAAVRPELLLPALAVYLLFEAALRARPETTQI